MAAVERARPSGLYAGFARVGGLLYSSGVVGRIDGQVVHGVLSGADDVRHGQAAASAAVQAILQALREEPGGLASVTRIVTLTGYLQTHAGFTHHVAVMDAASAALKEAFPAAPLPVRTTVGVASLPFGGTVEISMVFELAQG
jgi:enamine deaminase RidA (YjgF/YER057c/UK114 family)